MFGWLNKRFENTQREEVESFIISLKGADIGVINMISASTMFWAEMHKKENKDLYCMEEWLDKNLLYPILIGKKIKILQKQGTTTGVPGLMVWLFSARALLHPELRLSGRQIWSELNKSTIEAELLAKEFCDAMVISSSSLDRCRVPRGLEQLNR